VALADDDALARIAVGAMLESADWLELVGEADGVEEIVELVAAKRPEVVVLDWLMPDGGGPEAARRILDHRPRTLIVALTSSDSLTALTEMNSAGAACLVTKGGSADQLTQTIGRALRASNVARAAQEHDTPEARSLGGGRTGPDGPPASEPPLDPAGVHRLRSEFGSTGVLTDLVDLFGSQTPERLAHTRRAIEDDNAEAVRNHAHQLKGGCLTLAANYMAELCYELEMTADGGSLDSAAALVDQIEIAFTRAQVAMLGQLA
jgi:DNA-binding NarL/FixJ family response regulator/HPt (histidine-containing phosphotransfer) domain-containing protein